MEVLNLNSTWMQIYKFRYGYMQKHPANIALQMTHKTSLDNQFAYLLYLAY